MKDIRSGEREQIEAIKAWFQEHLLGLILAVLAFCAIFFGPDLYQSYRNSQIWPASDAYERLDLAVSSASSGPVATDSELALVDQLADQLIEEHADSHYAFLAALSVARLSADLGHFSAALDRLQWASEHAGNDADEQLVNFRLALLESQLGTPDSALERLAAPNDHFASLYAEARGDIHNSEGQRQEAAKAYQTALDTMSSDNTGRQTSLELKLANLETGLGSVSPGN